MSSIYALLAFVVVLTIASTGRAKGRKPPGPRGWPFVGNVLDVPKTNTHDTFVSWAKKYGNIVYISFFGKPTVILNTYETAMDLLEKKSGIYSDRPDFVLLGELIGWDHASIHLHYGPRWRKHRRFMQEAFRQHGVQKMLPVQRRAALRLVLSLWDNPEDFMEHIEVFVSSTILKVVYGKDIEDPNTARFALLGARAATATISASMSSVGAIVDIFPIVKYIPSWFPFVDFRRKAAEARLIVDELNDVPFDIVKDELKRGIAPPSMTASLVEAHWDEEQQLAKEDLADIRGMAGSLFSAAVDTSGSTLTKFILAMMLHQDVLKQAQQEIDRVVGMSNDVRLPDISDRHACSYLEAVLKELYRWNPTIPLGIPHRLMEDDVYNGYFLPKGAMIVANIEFMCKACEDPEGFRPERFLDPSKKLLDPRQLVFGFGRRRCPGRHFADSGIWLAIALILYSFDIFPVSDGPPPEAKFTSHFVRHPEPFLCVILPRRRAAPRTRELVEQTFVSLGART